jgi:endonuclease III
MEASSGLNAEDLRELHAHLKRLGQQTCRPFRADCRTCPLSATCLQRVETFADAQFGFAA